MKLKKSCNMLCLFLLLMTLCLFLSLQVSAEGTAPSFVISGGVLESYEGTDTVVEFRMVSRQLKNMRSAI